jgi:hypothetical protein
MSAPWKMIKPDAIDIVAPDGSVRCTVQGYYGGTHFFVDDMKVDVREGDEIRRMLPNGRQEAFIVQDPKYYGRGLVGPAHYQVRVGRSKVFDRQTGGNYNIHVSGANSRVNFQSTDQSTNTIVGDNLFHEVRKALDDGVPHAEQRAYLKGLLDEMETAPDKKRFTTSYQSLIASAADHITILTPFLTPLAELVQKLAS